MKFSNFFKIEMSYVSLVFKCFKTKKQIEKMRISADIYMILVENNFVL